MPRSLQQIAFALCIGNLAGCGPAGIFDFPVSAETDPAAWPQIQPLEEFPVLPSDGDDRPIALTATQDALAERANALRNRGACLARTSVLTSGERARLAEEVGQ